MPLDFPVAGIHASPVVPFLWSFLVGIVFSVVGAAGGILAGVGHISILGIPHANLIKPMNQILTIVSPLFSVPAYHRQGRVVYLLGTLLGLGGIAGSILGAWLSHRYLGDMKAYKPFFGLLTLIVAARIVQDARRAGRSGDRKGDRAALAFERHVREARHRGDRVDLRIHGVRGTHWSPSRVTFSFSGEEFGFQPALPFLAGLLVAVVSAAMGVGGGFLLVPFMTSVMGLPMFIVAGTAAFSILISSAASVLAYLRLGADVDGPLLAIEVAGVVLGSLLGPHLSRHLREKWLKGALAAVLSYIGAGYLLGPWIQAATGVRII